MRIDFSAVL